jgi:hypothetical protein
MIKLPSKWKRHLRVWWELGIFCWTWTAKKIKISKKITHLVGLLDGWFVCTTFIIISLLNSLVCFTQSFVCNLSRLNYCIKIVHAHQPCSNLYVFNDFNHCIFCIVCFWQSGIMTGTFMFHDRHKFIGAGHFDRQVPKISKISRLMSPYPPPPLASLHAHMQLKENQFIRTNCFL